MPMAWVGDNIFSFAQSYVSGFCVSCPESPDTVLQDLRELGPTYFFAPPRIFENILTTVMIRIEDAALIKQKLFHYFMAVAARVGAPILDGEPVSLKDRVLYWIGGVLVYGPLKNVLGFSRVRLAYTAGEAIGPDIFDFFRSLGMNIKQLYGSTEASVFITIQPDGEVKPDTVGPPANDVEIKIADNGEVIFRSPGVFMAYYKNEEATKATKTEDGWVHTGDAGFIDDDGHLRIIDRAKDVSKLNDGSMFAPKFLENKLKFFPFVKEAVTFGHDRDYVAAFVNIDLEAVGNWAERRHLAYSGYTDLAGRGEVADLVIECVEKVNRDLANQEVLDSAQRARCRRRRADPHPEGAARLYRRSLRGTHRRPLFGPRPLYRRGRGDVRGRAHRHHPRRSQDSCDRAGADRGRVPARRRVRVAPWPTAKKSATCSSRWTTSACRSARCGR